MKKGGRGEWKEPCVMYIRATPPPGPRNISCHPQIRWSHEHHHWRSSCPPCSQSYCDLCNCEDTHTLTLNKTINNQGWDTLDYSTLLWQASRPSYVYSLH